MTKQNQADMRWTVRFSDADDLARTRELVQIGAELDRVTMGRFLRLAVEQFTTERHGASLVERMIKLDRLSRQMDELLMACDQRDRSD